MLAKKITDSDDFISETEYLGSEQYAKVRHEYMDGKVYAMAGTSLRHNDIAMNIAFALRLAARAMPCDIHVTNIKVRAEKPKAYYYPDVIVGCADDETHDYYLEKPCLIVEVTSPSTEWQDRHQKTVAYQRILAGVFNRRARAGTGHALLPRCQRRVGCRLVRPARTNHSLALPNGSGIKRRRDLRRH